MRFVSKPIIVHGSSISADSIGRPEPGCPAAFVFEGTRYEILALLRSWRSTKTDRGDVYLKRHWFEVQTNGGIAVMYFDRAAKRTQSSWWLYSFSSEFQADSSPGE